MLVERVAAFVRGESGESFEKLALAVFRRQYERPGPFRDLCDQRGATPERIADWRGVPALPIADLAPAAEGSQPLDDTTLGALERAVIDRSFPSACLEDLDRPPVLSLIPPTETPRGCGPGSWADHVLDAWAAPDSLVGVATRGVEVAKSRSFLAARQRDRRPTLLLADGANLDRLLEALDRRGLRFRLPPGSRVAIDGGSATGGQELLARLADALAVPADGVVRQYGVGRMVSRFYAGHSRRGELRPFRPPPWARVRVLEPESLAEAPAGAAGLLSVYDLAGLGSAPHLLTGDVAVGAEDGFRLAGDATSPSDGPADR
ncbi:MAG: hypothetical protein ACE5EG_10450 [Thermoanaerobaculia bacterium]